MELQFPMKTIFVTFAAVTALAVPVQAQSFTAIGTPNNVSVGQQFWDNQSTDGRYCNVGFILTNAAPSATGSCGAQRPAGWLPYTGSAATQYYQNGSGGWQSFLFGAGTFNFTLLAGTAAPGGEVAGSNLDWGYFDYSGRTLHNFNSVSPTSILPQNGVVIGGTWGLYIVTTDGSTRYSDLDPQFALFLTPSFGGVIAGLEDINARTGGDRDYNDVMFKVEGVNGPLDIVPEPATMTLLAAGLAGMAAAGRRRRKSK